MFIGAAGIAASPTAARGKVTMSADARNVVIDARPEPLTVDLSKTAVLVVDMQNDFGANGGAATE